MKASFAWKQLKVDYSKNIWKEKNRGQGFVCPLIGYISVKKNIENCNNSVGAGAHKVGKVVSFGPNLTLIFPILGKREKGKLYILKKFGLSTFKKIL